MNFENRDIIAIGDFSRKELLKVLEVSKDIDDDKEKYGDLLKGKIVATLFFEPSTRTRMSFQAAMQRLGGSVIGFSEVSTTSMKKGETLSDTMRIVSGYTDVIVMRHPEIGSVGLAAKDSDVPIINAGDGTNEHPTQTMLDLYTIWKEKGGLDKLKVGFVGDLKYGRTVHSLTKALTHFNPEFVFISHKSLGMPEKYLKDLDSKGIKYSEDTSLSNIGDLDVLYVTRVQKERFESEEAYNAVKDLYKVDKSVIEKTKKEVIILHPLPRVDELDPELDDLPQSVYFKQAANGVPVRMALLALVLGKIK